MASKIADALTILEKRRREYKLTMLPSQSRTSCVSREYKHLELRTAPLEKTLVEIFFKTVKVIARSCALLAYRQPYQAHIRPYLRK